MPAKRRKSKARPQEVAAWAMFFQSGSDFFDDLAAIGLDEASAAPMAESTWHRIGAEVLDHLERFYEGYHPPARPFWAEREFGTPKGTKQAGRRRG